VYDQYTANLLEGKVDSEDYIPPNVQDVILSIDCEYMQYTDETFYCLEKFGKQKKKNLLAIAPYEVNVLCTSCKQAKIDEHNSMIAKEQRKESVKKLVDFARKFMSVTEEGFLTTTYMCTCNIIEGDVKFSRDGKTLICPLIDNEMVSIQDSCFSALNPKTEQPPCQYLIPLEHKAMITPEDMEKMNLTIPVVEYQEPYIDYEKMNAREPIRKDDEVEVLGNTQLLPDTPLEVEYKVIEVDETNLDICSECGESAWSIEGKNNICTSCGFVKKIEKKGK